MESGNLGRVYRIVEAPADQRLASPPSILVPTNQWKVMDPTQTQGTRSPGPPPPWPDTRDIPGYNFDFKNILVSFHVVLALAIKQPLFPIYCLA